MDPVTQEPEQEPCAGSIRTNEIEVRLREAEIANTGLDADDKRRYVVTVTIIVKFNFSFSFVYFFCRVK
jgi:hypothetical protein